MSDPMITRDSASPEDTKDISQLQVDASGNLVSSANITAANLVATGAVSTPSIISYPGSNADIQIQPDGTGALKLGPSIIELVYDNVSINVAGDTVGGGGSVALSMVGNITLTSTPSFTAGTNFNQIKIVTMTTGGVYALTLQDNATLPGSFLKLGAPTRSIAAGQSMFFVWDGTYWIEIGLAGAGFVVGPAVAVDNIIARFDSTTGKLIQALPGASNGAGTMSDVGTPTFHHLKLVANAPTLLEILANGSLTAERLLILTTPDADFTLTLTGTAASLTGTNTGDQTSIVGITGSLAEFNAALTGADFATGGGTVTGASSGNNTGDQTITLSGAVTGSGTGAIVTALAAHAATHKLAGSDPILLNEFGLPTGSVAFNGQQATSFRIENRTSEPGAPTEGQIWLRTDL